MRHEKPVAVMRSESAAKLREISGITQSDKELYLLANFAGKSIRKSNPEIAFAVISEAINVVAAANHNEPFAPEMAQIICESIAEEFGHLRPPEIKHALMKSLTGAIAGAPESTYGKIGLEWIGKSLRAYEEYRIAALKRVSDKMPKALPEYAGPSEIEVIEKLEQLARNTYAAACAGEEVLEVVLPEVLRYFQSIGYDLSDRRKIEIMKLAEKITVSGDAERLRTIFDLGDRAIERKQLEKSLPTRAKRKAMSIACRELMSEMKGRGIEL
jgi:hypothetical protein